MTLRHLTAVALLVPALAACTSNSPSGDAKGDERTITIKGIDEVDNLKGEVSWISPIARTLLKAREGDELQLMTPGGVEKIEVLEVRYPAPSDA